MKYVMMALVGGLALVAPAAGTTAAQATGASTAASGTTESKLTATTADVDYAMKTIDAAIKQYNALSDEQKTKLDRQAAKLVRAEDTAKFSAALRSFCETASTQSVMTVAMRQVVQKSLNDYPKWCGAVKAARMTSQAMSKMGLQGGDLSLEDIVRLLPQGDVSAATNGTATATGTAK